ncbi:Crp/Fnr family transcriptional regulator [Pedobacter agri]|uniref:Crp/Fnr family transcriptional regulator n=1 Tax=Pedobacter agri TaxID=454586 RepID=UPI00293094ED|nr:Crp/Fnr family transcriptional regulator [Pedobacter agri]
MKNLIEEANLFETLGFVVPLPAHFQKRLDEEILLQEFKKKHLVLRPGDICKRLYFVSSGFLRAFFIDDDGRECTTWFVGKGDLMISAYSFFTQQPAHEYIEVLEDCKLQSLTWKQINSFYADFREGNLLGRVFIEKYYITSEARAIFLRTNRPENRYNLLMATHPELESQTTQSNIASYLAISRETLSRIRRKKLANNRKQQLRNKH